MVAIARTTVSQEIEFIKKGQVTIPKIIRDMLGIAEGQKGTISVVGEAIMIVPSKPKTTELFEQLGEGLGMSNMSLDELLVEMRQIRQENGVEP